MPPKSCPSADTLVAFSAGLIPATEIDRIANHLDDCLDCQKRLAALDQKTVSLVDTLRRPGPGLSATGPDPSPTAEKSTASASAIGAGPLEEVRTLLRRRLIVVGVVGAIVAAALGMASIIGKDDRVTAASGYHGGLIVLAAYGVYAALVTAYIRARPSAPLGLLRWVELGHVAGTVAFACAFRWASLAAGADLAFSNANHRDLYIEQAVLLGNLSWYGLIVGYGVLIPNTVWRAVTVTVTLAIIALGSVLIVGLSLAYVRDHLPTMLGLTTVGVFLAGAIGVFGSYRINTLQAEVFAARQIGPYTIVRMLGSGGMGEVYLAEHRLLKRPCAVKLIRPEKARDPGLLRRFEREVQATARLTHPNTVEIFDYGRSDDGTFYYVMEYLPGMTLSELVQRQSPIAAGRAVQLLRQLCGALAEAHAAGLVHRDIKPGNVMVCDRGGMPEVVKLLDFGLVQLPDNDEGLTRDGVTLGTPDYMSPEQAAAGPADPRSDVYSLGALAYFLLTGRPPFVADSALDVLIAHRQNPPISPRQFASEVPADLEAIVLRCLEKRPADRFPDMSALDAALVACQTAPNL